MTPKTIRAKALPKHCVKAPKGFVPHRIKLQRQREAAEQFMNDCADWQEHLEFTDSLTE